MRGRPALPAPPDVSRPPVTRIGGRSPTSVVKVTSHVIAFAGPAVAETSTTPTVARFSSACLSCAAVVVAAASDGVSAPRNDTVKSPPSAAEPTCRRSTAVENGVASTAFASALGTTAMAPPASAPFDHPVNVTVHALLLAVVTLVTLTVPTPVASIAALTVASLAAVTSSSAVVWPFT
ncbi:hypothetical protein PINS_up012348 [Pythium insidiosum]|nr:hypothetical protein PINS_up012348 [Pythium insidiosum]